jgi:hypothetical protein
MMSSAHDHHEKAEQLLSAAGKEPNSTSRSLLLAEAQVHATLAVAAALGAGSGSSPARPAPADVPRHPDLVPDSIYEEDPGPE